MFGEPDTDERSLSDYAKEVIFEDAAQLMAFLGGEEFRAGRWIFRGQANAEWSLRPSLERFAAELRDSPSFVETFIESEFRRHAHHYVTDLPAPENTLDWFALMRHYGAPTRLLDFTKSPYVAAFFATAEASVHDSAAIWALDGSVINRNAGKLLSEGSLAANVKQHGERCAQMANSFSEPSIFRDVLTPGAVPARVVITVEPFRTNRRVLLQQGLFLCPVSLYVSFEHAMKNVLRAAHNGSGATSPILYKIRISERAHPNVLRELQRMNITSATLLPGLEGFAQSLASICKIRASTVHPDRPPDYGFAARF